MYILCLSSLNCECITRQDWASLKAMRKMLFKRCNQGFLISVGGIYLLCSDQKVPGLKKSKSPRTFFLRSRDLLGQNHHQIGKKSKKLLEKCTKLFIFILVYFPNVQVLGHRRTIIDTYFQLSDTEMKKMHFFINIFVPHPIPESPGTYSPGN